MKLHINSFKNSTAIFQLQVKAFLFTKGKRLYLTVFLVKKVLYTFNVIFGYILFAFKISIIPFSNKSLATVSKPKIVLNNIML